MNNKNKEEIKKDFSVFAKHFLLKQPNEVQAKEDNIIIEQMKKNYPWQEVFLDKMPNEKIEQETIQKTPFEEFVKFNISGELLPYQKEMLNFIENKKNISEDEFRTQYMIQPFKIGKTFKNTKREDRKQRCGDCTFFGDKGCTTSYLEAKYGNKNTPACSEFSPKILGTKTTMIIVDDPIKK